MYFLGKAIIYSEKRKCGIAVGYRPHLAKKNSDELYGIEFLEASENAVDKYVDCIINTPYEKVDYSCLKINEKYDIREGRNVVGEIVLLGRM